MKTPRRTGKPPARKAAPPSKRRTAPRKEAVAATPPKPLQAGGPESKGCKIAFKETPPGRDAQGRLLRRFFQLETLVHAIERAIERQLPPFSRVAEGIEGGAESLRLRLELLREDDFKLVFRLATAGTVGKRAAFILMVAKNAEECAKRATAQWSLMKTLAARAPGLVLAPLQTGTVFLPDRHRRVAHHRDVAVWLGEDLPGYAQIGSNKQHQFVLLSAPPVALSVAETEQVKARLVELAARSFDARERTALDVGSLAAGDLLVRRGGGSVTYLRIGGAKQLMQRATPARVLDGLQNATWNWGHGPFHPIPRDPEMFLGALEKALGKAIAREWVGEYVQKVQQGRVPKRNPEYFVAFEKNLAG